MVAFQPLAKTDYRSPNQYCLEKVTKHAKQETLLREIKESRLTEKTGDPAPEQEDGILPLPVLLAFGAATTLVANVEARLLTLVAGAIVGFTVVATTALLL